MDTIFSVSVSTSALLIQVKMLHSQNLIVSTIKCHQERKKILY